MNLGNNTHHSEELLRICPASFLTSQYNSFYNTISLSSFTCKEHVHDVHDVDKVEKESSITGDPAKQ